MKARNGILTYELVYCFFPREIFSLKEDGFFSGDGRKRGLLIKSISAGQVMYLHPEKYLAWLHGKPIEEGQ